MSEISIRDIRPEDYPEVYLLWKNELGLKRLTPESMENTYSQMSGDSRYRTFVAVCEGAVVGLATVVETMAVDFAAGYLKLNGLAVKTEFRRRGIATALMARVEDYARERGLASVGVASGFQRTGAHAFYERIGYEKGSYYFSKRL